MSGVEEGKRRCGDRDYQQTEVMPRMGVEEDDPHGGGAAPRRASAKTTARGAMPRPEGAIAAVSGLASSGSAHDLARVLEPPGDLGFEQEPGAARGRRRPSGSF